MIQSIINVARQQDFSFFDLSICRINWSHYQEDPKRVVSVLIFFTENGYYEPALLSKHAIFFDDFLLPSQESRTASFWNRIWLALSIICTCYLDERYSVVLRESETDGWEGFNLCWCLSQGTFLTISNTMRMKSENRIGNKKWTSSCNAIQRSGWVTVSFYLDRVRHIF